MLGLAASIYEKIVVARNRRFDGGDTPALDLGARTISIGNITAGGTGKTPLVIKTAEMLAARGKRVCILTRGYGRKQPKSRVVVSDGREINMDPSLTGDEPLEIALRLRGKAVVIADPDRVAAAEWARERFGINTFVLDDAFQHRRARRDVDIVCIDALDPFGGGRLLPAGRLREPVSHLRRAGMIVITRADLGGDIAGLRAEIAKYAPETAVFTSRTVMKAMTDLTTFLGETAETDYSSIANRKGFAFCGLGNPQVFFRQLERDNFELAGEKAFRDHKRYSQKHISAMEAEAARSGAAYLITTAKDAVKLKGLRLTMPCFVTEISAVIDDEAAFTAML